MGEEETIPRMARSAEMGKEQERSLRRMKLFATGLLVFMAALYTVCRAFQARHPALRFVAAFSEAGTIGALADWFAVVALFRHPLGLPIPRTAVIPRNRDRIGESLARFIKDNFLTKELLEKRMAAVDLAGLMAAWLSEERNARFIAERAAEYAPSLLGRQRDDPKSADGADHPGQQPPALFYRIAEAVRENALVRKAAAGLLAGLDRLGLPLSGRTPEPGEAAPGAGKASYGPVAKMLKEKLMRDLANPDSDLVRRVTTFIQETGRGALTDEGLKQRINQGLRGWISEAMDENRELFALFISETVRKWDPEATSRRIELSVGKDLQWIRINGTIVGGLAGLLIAFLSYVLGGFH